MVEKIAFIGVGNMGGPMAENLLKSGNEIKVFDVSNLMLEKAKEKGLEVATNIKDLISKEISTVITMLCSVKSTSRFSSFSDVLPSNIQYSMM